MVRTEFHMHTKSSNDSLMWRHALLNRCKEAYLDCLAITDHNEISGALTIRSWFESRGVAVIVGEEIFTTEGEMIGLWLSQRIQPGLTPEAMVAEDPSIPMFGKNKTGR